MSVISVQTTAPGRGAIAVVEVVGEGAASLVAGLLDRPLPAPGKTALGTLKDDGPLDEVVVRVIPPAESFTGEETVEINCHGGEVVVGRVLSALEFNGAPCMDPGALLDRAMANGRIDRLQAEAHELLPRALTERAARMLLDQAEGALSKAVREGRYLLDTASYGLALTVPRRVVIAGRPNVGKSTLFNRLMEQDRVIVSATAGTTRDPVRELIAIEQIPIQLVDTAGVEKPQNLLEQLSIDRTHKMLKSAHAVIFLFDAEAGAQGEEMRFIERLAHRHVIFAVNKSDAGNKKPIMPALPISARTGEGIDELRYKILNSLEIGAVPPPGSPVVFTQRQKELLEKGDREELFL